jgi:hypothetical protein
MPDLAALYRFRFREDEREKRRLIWKTPCQSYFQRLVGDSKVVADLACGYGEFINNIKAARKYGIDLNPDAPKFLTPEVQFCACRADKIDAIGSGSAHHQARTAPLGGSWDPCNEDHMALSSYHVGRNFSPQFVDRLAFGMSTRLAPASLVS